MTWLYILIDILILMFALALILVVLYFWNKKKELSIGSLSEFRNSTIYEKSYEDQKKKAHIEEIVEDETSFIDDEVENDEEPVKEVAETSVVEEIPAVKEPEYSYSDMNQTMYASQSVNVRNLPSTDGDKVGGLSAAQAVAVTGKCNETGWYRIEYNGGEAFVSDSYLVNEKPVQQEPTTQPSGSSNSSDSGSDGSSVTVPSHEDTVGNLVWVPTKGGKKYHSRSGCSNMEGPMQVTVEHATALGYTPCKRCH